MHHPWHILFSLVLNWFFLPLMFLPFLIPIPLILLLTHSLMYKPIAKEVQPVLAPLEKKYHVLHWSPDNPLAGLITLLTNPLEFVPEQRFTHERADALDLNPAQWLWPKGVKLVWWMVLNHETTFTWTTTECG